MRIKIIFLSANRNFTNRNKKEINKVIFFHAKKASQALSFKQKIFVFTIYPWERNGVSAFTQAKDWVRITINPIQFASNNRKRSNMIERLIYIVYHEMHHAARGYVGFLPENKYHILMNSIVSEGLADIFAREQYPSPYVLKITKYNLKQIRKWFPKIGKIKWKKEIFYDPWLHGGLGKPRLLGYKTGRYIIENLKKSKPRFTAAKLARWDAKKILRFSKVKI